MKLLPTCAPLSAEVNPLRADLTVEFWGDGKNAFVGVDTTELKLSESRSFKNGFVWLTYERV